MPKSQTFGQRGGGARVELDRSRGAQEYTFTQLQDYELRAVAWLNSNNSWNNITQRFQSFHRALVNVALQYSPELATLPNTQAFATPGEATPELHVLVAGDSDITCENHMAHVRSFRPQATVHACHRSEDGEPDSWRPLVPNCMMCSHPTRRPRRAPLPVAFVPCLKLRAPCAACLRL